MAVTFTPDQQATIDARGSSILAVSYTHLDVYKRQLFPFAEVLFTDFMFDIPTEKDICSVSVKGL